MLEQLLASTESAFDLRVDGRPGRTIGVADRLPRLAWRMPAIEITGICVEAASSAAALEAGSADLWAVELDGLAIAVLWAGHELTGGSEVHWRVGVCSPGQSMTWSAPAVFEIAIDDTNWSGSWITAPAWVHPAEHGDTPLPILGRDFELSSPVRRGRLHVCGGGVFDVSLNGQPVGDEVLAPGYSVEAKRVPAMAWDVTELLAPGLNRLRIGLGPGIAWVPPIDGRYSKLSTSALVPRVLAQLEIQTDDGAVHILTDQEWSTSDGPVLASHWYGGEDIDGRGDDRSGPIEPTHGWGPVEVLGAAGLHQPWWPERPPLRVRESVQSVSVTELDDVVVVDLGMNIAGWPVVRFDSIEAGRRVEIWPAELLDERGHVDQRSIGTPTWDSYITREGEQLWHPRFVYHGFRFLELRGVRAEEVRVEGWVIHADNQRIGHFDADDPYLVRLHQIIDRALLGNMYSVFTDCPNREKLGWIEQLHLCFGLITRSFDVEAHLRSSLTLMRDAQRSTGLVPSIVPETTDFTGAAWGGDETAFVDDPNWGGAIALVASLHFAEYGDARVLTENWPAIERYLKYLEGRSADDLLDYGLGDWITLDDSTPRGLVASFGWTRTLQAAAQIRELLGDTSGAARLSARADRVVAAFRARYGSADGAIWGSGSEASQALALALGAVPEGARPAAYVRLRTAIDAAESRLTVGEVSWPSLMAVLHAAGDHELIDYLVRADDGPGYGWQIKLGATALGESWLGAAGVDAANSQNHFMLGMVNDWILDSVGGLRHAESSTAWSTAEVGPTPPSAVASASTSTLTARGRYAVEWRGDSERSVRELVVEVPSGGSARLNVPGGDGECLTVGTGRWRWTA